MGASQAYWAQYQSILSRPMAVSKDATNVIHSCNPASFDTPLHCVSQLLRTLDCGHSHNVELLSP